MNLPNPSQGPHPTPSRLDAIAAELQLESEKLRRLAEELRAHEQAHQEMLAHYPQLEKMILALLCEQCLREVPPIPADKDLETFAREEGAMPFETLLSELGIGDVAP